MDVSATSVDIKRVTKNRVNNLARGISRTFPVRLASIIFQYSSFRRPKLKSLI